MSTVFDDVWYVSPHTAPSNHEEKLRHVETSSKHLPGWVWLAPVASGLWRPHWRLSLHRGCIPGLSPVRKATLQMQGSEQASDEEHSSADPCEH